MAELHQGINQLDSKVTDSREGLGTALQELREIKETGVTVLNAIYVLFQDLIRGEKMIGEYDPGP